LIARAGSPTSWVTLQSTPEPSSADAAALDRTQLRLPDGEVDVDRRGVHVAVGVLVGDEARDVDVRDDQRRRESFA
jgi:hypothetical protein